MTSPKNVDFSGSTHFFKDYAVVFQGIADFCEHPRLNELYAIAKKRDASFRLHVFYDDRDVQAADITYSLCYLYGVHQFEPADIRMERCGGGRGGAALTEEIGQLCSVYLARNLDQPERERVARLQRLGLKIVWSAADVQEMIDFDEPFDPGSYFTKRLHDKGRVWYAISEVPPHFVDRVRMGYGSKLYEPYISYSGGATINIGKASYISVNPRFFIDADFHLGNFCQVSTDFTAVTRRHSITTLSLGGVAGGAFGYFGEKVDKQDEVRIGSDVWIGTKVSVLPGVTIGHGCVIGAASVVTDDCKPYGIYAGNPATLVRDRFPEDKTKVLLESKWWDWPLRKIWTKRETFRQKVDSMSAAELLDALSD